MFAMDSTTASGLVSIGGRRVLLDGGLQLSTADCMPAPGFAADPFAIAVTPPTPRLLAVDGHSIARIITQEVGEGDGRRCRCHSKSVVAEHLTLGTEVVPFDWASIAAERV